MSHPAPVLPQLAEYPSSMFAVLAGSNADPQTRERRSFAIGAAASVLIHALLLLVTLHYRPDPQTMDGGAPHEPITVRLANRAAPAPKASPAPPQPRQEQRRAKVIAVPRQNSLPSAPALPVEPAPAQPQIEPQIDMAAMVNAARERRQRMEDFAARENAEAAGRTPSANDVAAANIQRSLNSKRDGVGGVFQILHKGVRTGSFAFRGWKPGARNSTYQTFEVDAGPGGNVELALVRRIIELIRTHYTGDFPWESHRLGRVFIKSARPQDNAELEAFLMREFFGDDGLARGY